MHRVRSNASGATSVTQCVSPLSQSAVSSSNLAAVLAFLLLVFIGSIELSFSRTLSQFSTDGFFSSSRDSVWFDVLVHVHGRRARRDHISSLPQKLQRRNFTTKFSWIRIDKNHNGGRDCDYRRVYSIITAYPEYDRLSTVLIFYTTVTLKDLRRKYWEKEHS